MNVEIEMTITATVDCKLIAGTSGHKFTNGQWYPEDPDEVIINSVSIGKHKIPWIEFQKVLNKYEIEHVEAQVMELASE